MGVYNNPLETRYASSEMLEIFSDIKKFATWRQVWITLAESEKELGLSITDDQIDDLKKNKDNLNIKRAKEIEKEIHHDVMSHIMAYGEVAVKAKGIIHLGATSAFVTDNAETVILREAMLLIKRRLITLINALKEKSLQYKGMPTQGYTHLQPAQPTTVGKRMSLWLYDLTLDFEDLETRINNLYARGAKGTTGTQASFMKLFEGDEDKVKKLDNMVARRLGFDKSIPISGQTLTRKIDFQVLSVLSSIAQSSHKAANDIRLLQHRWEIEEPFSKRQVGSSAMPYKRNPILAERMTSLARYLINDLQNAAYNFSNQFLERTLDDSANRRILIAESFLLADSILIIYQKMIDGLNVYPEVIKTTLKNNLPFYATENILMESVKNGGNRQELHELIREFAMKTVDAIRKGANYDMLFEMKKSGKFPIPDSEWEKIGDYSNYTGRAERQVEDFISDVVEPLVEKHKKYIGIESRIRV